LLDENYRRSFVAATEAEVVYLDAVRRGEERMGLIDLAMDARDRWVAIATLCALGEDDARWRLAMPPLRGRQESVHNAWLDRRNWAVRAEDAAARAELLGALMNAHRGDATTPRRPLRLVAVPHQRSTAPKGVGTRTGRAKKQRF
jgi:hypothetical protein